ncbi:MAG: SMP-30/gluconolactonase/LRE family protein [Planctomycetota bacterium]|nr:MAG: SMP-30/gluconolactonase/LRE family protein [Planctomycetota bacterium]
MEAKRRAKSSGKSGIFVILVVLIYWILGGFLVSDVRATKIYWTDRDYDRIQRANLDGTNIENLITTGVYDPRGITVDLFAGKMYWIDNYYDNIQRANLDGSNVENIVTGLTDPYGGIALDVIAGTMYWTEYNGHRIRRANVDGSNIRDIITGLSYPFDIALDVSAGKIYWTDDGTDKIQRANLDGTSLEDLVTGLSSPRGIALDLSGRKMYWTDSGYDRIQRANLDGSNVETLINTGGPYGITLDLSAGKMYWTDYSNNKIQRANLDGSNAQDILTGLGDYSFGITISQYLIIDDLQIEPWGRLISSGPVYGPFTPECISHTLTNAGPNTISWNVDWTADWFDVTPDAGTLASGASVTVQVCINSHAHYLEPGVYNDHVTFLNANSGIKQTTCLELRVQYQQRKLLALDGYKNDHFGHSVSIDGEYAIVGAHLDDDKGSNSGSAYIFKHEGEIWSQQAKLIPSDGSDGDNFGYSVSIDGDYAIVGSYHDDDKGSDSGSVYIFRREGETWTQQTKLLASDGYTFDYFGVNVSIDGDYAIVGSNDESAYIFKREAEVWSEQVKLKASDWYHNDYFGSEVSIDGEYAIVGACGDDYNNVSDAGSAYIFKRDGNSWSQQAKLLASDGCKYDYFGRSVSIDGDCVIIGAHQNTSSGSAYIFKRDGTTWSGQVKLTPSDGHIGDYFGCSVSIDGEYVIVGAFSDDDNGSNSGSAYVFGIFNTGPVSCVVGGDRLVEADSNCEGRVVLDGSCSSDEDSTAGTNDDINDFDWYEVIDACEPNSDIYLGSGEVIECNLGLGEHLIVLEVTDKAGAYDSNEVVITVEDVTPPEFSLFVEPNVLWPPNHRMVRIDVSWEVSDNCDEQVQVSLVGVTSSEEDDGRGDGRTKNDIIIADDGSIYLRAERTGSGAGRIYTITYEAVDDSGNATEASAEVLVPDGYRWRHRERIRDKTLDTRPKTRDKKSVQRRAYRVSLI